MANVSNLMISDDHEIADDWGEEESHKDKNSLDFFVGTCAHKVYREYQVQLRTSLNDASLRDSDHFTFIHRKIGFGFIELHTGNTIFKVGYSNFKD